jgi:hypothetical protein
MKPKIFIGPMSKNIVDSIIEFSNEANIQIGLIPSRRQIEHSGGYVNKWTTKNFCEYVTSKSSNILLVRDHCGPNQGLMEDDGIDSFTEDCKYFDIIHVDVWKKHQLYEDGLNSTLNFIKLGYSINKNLCYEIGTEEAIRRFEPEEIEKLIIDLKSNLPDEVYSKIKYIVIQSGTALKENKNIGTYDKDRLKKMISICKKYGLISKEHNGDYLNNEVLNEKFSLGLDSINIAPEFGQIETKTILQNINKEQIEEFFQICLESKKWEKWISKDFNPMLNKLELINICGHYLFSNDDFLKIKNQIKIDIDSEINSNIKKRINELINFSNK